MEDGIPLVIDYSETTSDSDDDDNVELISAEKAEEILKNTFLSSDDESEDEKIKRTLKELTSVQRIAQKPNIEFLDDAVVFTEEHGIVFLPQVGDGLIIQYPESWRDTSYYRIQSINDETGRVGLWSTQRQQQALTNYRDAAKYGLILKSPPEGASELRMAIALGEKKRGRPRKQIMQEQLEEQKIVSSTEPKRGRGRPPGSTNRPKEVILAEKKALREERMKKAELRKMRKILKKMH